MSLNNNKTCITTSSMFKLHGTTLYCRHDVEEHFIDDDALPPTTTSREEMQAKQTETLNGIILTFDGGIYIP